MLLKISEKKSKTFSSKNCHLYHYAGNNPIKYIDLDGYQDDLVCLSSLGQKKIEKFMEAQNKVSSNLKNFITILNNYRDSGNFNEPNIVSDSATKWLKVNMNTSEDINEFIQTLDKIKSQLDGLTLESVEYDAHNYSDIAYVKREHSNNAMYGSTGNKTLVLCDAFFFNKTDREDAIMHEMSHYVLNTKDISYDASKLPNLDKKNASNWGKFYTEAIK